MDDVWLTTQAAADLAGVSRPFIVKLCDQRIVTFRQVGNRRRVSESSLLAWLNDHTFTSGSGEQPPDQSDELVHDESAGDEHHDPGDDQPDPATPEG